jgi:hypothetical protein
MGTYRPLFLKEGPATACILHGQLLGYAICGGLTTAEGIDRDTYGHTRISGCQVRDQTVDGQGKPDVSGGTTIEQDAAVAAQYGVHVEIHTGANVASPTYLAARLQAFRGASVGGNLGALIGTPHQSNGVPVNHRVWVNEARGGELGKPAEVLVYDSMANGRKASWGTAPTGPQWWSWSTFLAYCFALRPWGDDDHRTLKSLGINGIYAGIYPRTDPLVTLWTGAHRTTPFPDRQVVNAKPGVLVNVRLGPSRAYRVQAHRKAGDIWTAYQYKPRSATVAHGYYGNADGNRWIDENDLIGRGGAT